MKGVKAIIFDMDGVLVDSMLHWKNKDIEFFGKRGFDVTEDMIKYMTGRSIREIAGWIKENYAPNENEEDLIREKHGMSDEIYHQLTLPMPGVENLFSKVKDKKLLQAIASGAPGDIVKIVVDRFSWHDHFEILISSDDVDFIGKPDPGIFLHTADKLKLRPEDCIVIEDAENGVVAAKRAGMKCIAVPDKRWSFGVFDEADLIVDSLEDKKIYKYLGL